MFFGRGVWLGFCRGDVVWQCMVEESFGKLKMLYDVGENVGFDQEGCFDLFGMLSLLLSLMFGGIIVLFGGLLWSEGLKERGLVMVLLNSL